MGRTWTTRVIALSLATLAMGTPAEGAVMTAAEKIRATDCEKRAIFWRRALLGKTNLYCQLLRRAQARLWSEPVESARLSKEALEQVPKGRGAQLLLAHAIQLQGDSRAAHEAFEKVLGVADGKKEPSSRSYLSLTLRVAAARAALQSAHYPAALRHYRGAVLRLEELSPGRERARILIEAAAAATYKGNHHGREARNYLRLAAEQNAPLLRRLIVAALALSLWRDGEAEEARRVVASQEDSWKLRWIFDRNETPVGVPGEVLPLLPPGESAALSAVVAESVERKAAMIHWERFYQLAAGGLPAHLLSSKDRSGER